MIDSHCHLTHPRLALETEAVVDRARAAGLAGCVAIGTGVEDARRVLEISERFAGFVFAAAGMDPFSSHRAGESFDADLERLCEMLASRRFCAVGEAGLDYHYDLDPRPVQAARFERQLALAEELDLPVIIHVREAHDDLRAILADHRKNRGVIHSFSGGPREAEGYLDLGWHLGFTGAVTFRNADILREAARMTPAARLLVETDAPYLAPEPLRGRRNEPAMLALTVAHLAELRGVDAVTLGTTAGENSARLFDLSQRGS
jgi:TatD DNase family protein